MSRRVIWKIYSHVYDSLLILRPYKSLLSDLINISDFKNDELIVDLGCGTANLELLCKNKKAKFFCFDFSEEMISRARKKCPQNQYMLYDLGEYRIPLKNSSVDKVISNNVIYNIEDLDRFFLDVNRVLKKGGVFVFSTSHKSGILPVIRGHFHEISMKETVATIINLPALMLVLFLNIVIDWSSKYKFYSKEEINRNLEANNFKVELFREGYEGINVIVSARKT